MNKLIRIALGLLLLLTIVFPVLDAAACTGIRVKAKDGSVVCGRTMEFADFFGFLLVAVPRNLAYPDLSNHEEYAHYKGMKWVSKYAVVGISSKFSPSGMVEGLNEKGLSVGSFYHKPLAKYQQPTGKEFLKTLNSGDFTSYLLTSYASVNEIISAIRTNAFLVQNGYVYFKSGPSTQDSMLLQLHYFVNDPTGRSLIIEFIDGKIVCDTSNIGVITNCPEYSWHKQNLSNYVNLVTKNADINDIGKDAYIINKLGNGSGMLGLPGDMTPPSRFVRAFFFSKSMDVAASAKDAVDNVFHVLNSFDIAKGYIGVSDGLPEQTLWTAASDLTNLRFYYHTYSNRQIRMFDLKNNLDKLGSSVVILDSTVSTATQAIYEIKMPQ